MHQISVKNGLFCRLLRQWVEEEGFDDPDPGRAKGDEDVANALLLELKARSAEQSAGIDDSGMYKDRSSCIKMKIYVIEEV